jgi:hypothetical protein
VEVDVTDECMRGAARFALRWPKARNALKRRLETDPRVAELCEAYEAACAAAEHWTRAGGKSNIARAEEYRALAAATEQDILEALDLEPR